jgi:hypothetical protein
MVAKVFADFLKLVYINSTCAKPTEHFKFYDKDALEWGTKHWKSLISFLINTLKHIFCWLLAKPHQLLLALHLNPQNVWHIRSSMIFPMKCI